MELILTNIYIFILANMGLFILLTTLTILFSLFVLDIDNWVKKP